MPRRRIPSYRCFKPKNLGLVVIEGKQHYLGRYGTPESLAEYNRLIQEWLTRLGNSAESRGEPASPTCTDDPTVNELIVAFWSHAEHHYRAPDGRPTGEQDNFKLALRPIKQLYGDAP